MFYSKDLSFFRAFNLRPIGEGDDTTTVTPPTPPVKTFSQDEVNKFLADDRRKSQTQLKQLTDELTQFRQTAQLTTEQKEQLETRIAELEKQTMTVEELSKRDQDKIRKEAEGKQQVLVTERDSYKTMFESNLIEAQLSRAATVHKALSVEQISALLRGTTKVIYGKDESGNPTYGVEVSLADKDREGKPITLKVSPEEALKRMKELPDRFGNLFVNEQSPGLGGNNVNRGATGVGGYRSGMTIEEYRKSRGNILKG